MFDPSKSPTFDYDMVEGSSPSDLVAKVRAKIKDGWRPHGAPFFVPSILCQAMVRGDTDASHLGDGISDITNAIQELVGIIDRK